MQSVSNYHVPVMLKETLDSLSIRENGVYIDCTAGGGGHLLAIASCLSKDGLVIGIDRDQDALNCIREKLKTASLNCQIQLVHESFSNVDKVCGGVDRGIDGILVDFGVSSHQLDDAQRGFTYRVDSRLDMRMDQTQSMTAETLLKTASAEELDTILSEYGEVRNSKRMAQALHKKFTECEGEITSNDLLVCLREEYGHDLQPQILSKIFQAFRIAVNEELKEIEEFLPKAYDLLKKDGRLVVLSYHSLEDRIVKQFINGHRLKKHDERTEGLQRVYKKALQADEQERLHNKRSRSVRLRVAAKI